MRNNSVLKSQKDALKCYESAVKVHWDRKGAVS